MIERQGDVGAREKQRKENAQHADEAQKASVLPAHECVVRGMQQVKKRHRRDQRVGSAVGQYDDLAILNAGSGAVGALGEQHLRRQGKRPVLDELFQLPKSMHDRGRDALHAFAHLGERFLARDALHVEYGDAQRNALTHRGHLRDQGRGLDIAAHERDVRAQAFHKPLL